ncbi:MAG: hypothetical protein ABI402_00630 [Ferruginibacter sp.]
MFSDDTKSKLENIIRGSLIQGENDYCTTIRNYLCTSYSTSTTVKRNFESNELIKKEQSEKLREYATQNKLWIEKLPDQFLAEGGESKVYLVDEGTYVIKINFAYYYATWLEYFNSLLFHNLIFSDTAYSFVGFIEINNILHAVLKQPFIKSDEQAELGDIKEFLEHNGFEKSRREDYYNKKYGLILEDMHDENVIVNSEKLFFIDTVFYIDTEGASINKNVIVEKNS